jgi:hypothetical protein
MASGPVPTGIAGSALPVATSIGVTVSPPPSVTYAVLPFGVIAIPDGPGPTLIGLPGWLVAVLIGSTVSAVAFAT